MNEETVPPVMPATTPLRTCTGPWTVHLCVTAACTRCGAVPVDEDTGLAPHFACPGQAVDELTQEWGWYFATFPARLGRAEELLCPGCTTAAGYLVRPRPPAPSASPDKGLEPETAPDQEYPEQPGKGFPPTPAASPAADPTREG